MSELLEYGVQKRETELFEKLTNYSKSDYYPFHMPGHKRRELSELVNRNNSKEAFLDFPNPYSIDITEIDGFDNLHHAEGILKDSMEHAAKIYGADYSYYLVNGSTCGILSAICGCTNVGGKILMARNCHKAAYHGAILNQLEIEYLYPQYIESYGINGGVLAEDVRAALEKDKKIQAVLIVSPTYEGIVSDIQAIADVVHEYGIVLIVDEAHGAHFPFCYHRKPNCESNEAAESKFPKSALDCGADIVIQSLHKTLPSFTQTAIMHLKGDLVNRAKIERYLGIFQSSSPSYLFMAAMERCVLFMDGAGREEMRQYEERMLRFFDETKKLKVLQVLDHRVCEEESVFDWDMSKIVISIRQTMNFIQKTYGEEKEEKLARFNGENLGEILRERYHLEMEMMAPEYVIAMTSFMDTEDGLKRLEDALAEIDEGLCNEILKTVFHEQLAIEKKKYMENNPILSQLPKAVVSMRLAEAMDKKGNRITFSDSLNCVSQEFVYLYPPGIPILAPGERITKEILERITWYQDMGLSVQGLSDPSLYSIITVAEE